jgi:hypothetical protein
MLQAIKQIFGRGDKRIALPIGRAEYEAWAARIIAGANVPGLTTDSANFQLTSMLLHLPSTESMKGDAFFVHALRKAAVNETAFSVMKEIEQRLQARKAAEAAAKSAEAAKASSPPAPLKLVEPSIEKGSEAPPAK